MNYSKLHNNIKDYLQGKLDTVESQKLEESMSVSDFDNDALEGLTQLENKNKLDSIVFDLNRQLNNEIKKRKKRKINSTEPAWIALISLITILLTILMAFYIYRLFMLN